MVCEHCFLLLCLYLFVFRTPFSWFEKMTFLFLLLVSREPRLVRLLTFGNVTKNPIWSKRVSYLPRPKRKKMLLLGPSIRRLNYFVFNVAMLRFTIMLGYIGKKYWISAAKCTTPIVWDVRSMNSLLKHKNTKKSPSNRWSWTFIFPINDPDKTVPMEKNWHKIIANTTTTTHGLRLQGLIIVAFPDRKCPWEVGGYCERHCAQTSHPFRCVTGMFMVQTHL